jgi:hypothetical protein
MSGDKYYQPVTPNGDQQPPVTDQRQAVIDQLVALGENRARLEAMSNEELAAVPIDIVNRLTGQVEADEPTT